MQVHSEFNKIYVFAIQHIANDSLKLRGIVKNRVIFPLVILRGILFVRTTNILYTFNHY